MIPPLTYGSVCSGLEAATLAWSPLGWRCAFVSEIEPTPARLLMQRMDATRPLFPALPEHATDLADRNKRALWLRQIEKMPQGGRVPNFGDMTRFNEWPDDIAIDVLIGGTPCQSFSVAGLRRGLADPRGSLMLVFGAIAARYRPAWVVWENVPGVLSNDGGRSFASLLGLLSGQDVEPPADGKWSNSGIVAGYPNAYGLAWRVLDAQYFGLAQRRARVFVVGYLGDWRPSAAVLFEQHCMRGDSPPRRKAGETVAASLIGSTGGVSKTDDIDGRVLVAPVAFGGNNTQGAIDVATAVRAKGGTGHGDFESETFLVQPFAFKPSHYTREKDGAPADITPPLSADADKGDQDTVICAPIAFSCKDYGQDASVDVAPTLRAMSEHEGNANAGGQVAVVYDTTQITNPNNRANPKPGDPAPPLAAQGHAPMLVYTLASRGRGDTHNLEYRTDGLANAILTPSGGRAGMGVGAIATAYAVRRLTPREAERLQGVPDDYTLIQNANGKPIADGPRYKMLGNSFAVTVVRWIGERIDLVRSIMAEAA